MASQQTLECMAELYQGEILGERIFDALAPEFREPLAKRVVLAILQAESETKARLRPSMVKLGVPVEAAKDLSAQADAVLAQFKGLSWADTLVAFRAALTDVYIPRFREIAEIAAEDGDPLAIEVANYMVVHETAFLEMIDRINGGDPNPTMCVDALMHFPMPAARVAA